LLLKKLNITKTREKKTWGNPCYFKKTNKFDKKRIKRVLEGEIKKNELKKRKKKNQASPSEPCKPRLNFQTWNR